MFIDGEIKMNSMKSVNEMYIIVVVNECKFNKSYAN